MKKKVLGIPWDRQSDKFIINFGEITFEEIITKRSILSTVASVYDPLGFVNPVIVQMKILFQDICLTKVGWDEELSTEISQRWRAIISDLKEASDVTLDRIYCFRDLNDPFVKIEVHTFSDASKRAHGCCVYLRFVYTTGKTHLSFLTAVTCEFFEKLQHSSFGITRCFIIVSSYF